MMTQQQEVILQTSLTKAHFDYQKRLNVYAFFKIQDRGASEDLVQETFIKTWKYLLKGGKIDVMKAFLYHILNNLIVDQYRKQKPTSLDTLLEKGFEPGVEDWTRLFDFLDGKAAFVLIGRLPEKYQRIMRMKYVQELTLQEMSLITGQSKNVIAVQAHRGLEKLKYLYNHPSKMPADRV